MTSDRARKRAARARPHRPANRATKARTTVSLAREAPPRRSPRPGVPKQSAVRAEHEAQRQQACRCREGTAEIARCGCEEPESPARGQQPAHASVILGLADDNRNRVRTPGRYGDSAPIDEASSPVQEFRLGSGRERPTMFSAGPVCRRWSWPPVPLAPSRPSAKSYTVGPRPGGHERGHLAHEPRRRLCGAAWIRMPMFRPITCTWCL